MFDFEDTKVREEFVQRYRQNRLSEEELEVFEDYLMDHPEVVEMIEIDNLLETGVSSYTKKSSKFSFGFSGLKWLFSGAAIAYGSVFFVSFVQQNDVIIQKVDDLYYIDLYRSSEDVERIIGLNNSRNNVMLLLPAPINDDDVYKVVILKRATSKILDIIENNTVTSSGEIALLLNTDGFEPGLYTFEVVSQSTSEVVSIDIKFVDKQK